MGRGMDTLELMMNRLKIVADGRKVQSISVRWENMGEFSGDVLMPQVTVVFYDAVFIPPPLDLGG